MRPPHSRRPPAPPAPQGTPPPPSACQFCEVTPWHAGNILHLALSMGDGSPMSHLCSEWAIKGLALSRLQGPIWLRVTWTAVSLCNPAISHPAQLRLGQRRAQLW